MQIIFCWFPLSCLQFIVGICLLHVCFKLILNILIYLCKMKSKFNDKD